METFSVLLAPCARTLQVTDEPPSQRSATHSFDVFFDLRLNKRVINRKAGDLRRHRAYYDVILMYGVEIYAVVMFFIISSTCSNFPEDKGIIV